MRMSSHRSNEHIQMPNAYMREVLLRELRAHRVSVDRLASYLLVMTDTNVPCPRCYGQGRVALLAVAAPNDGTERAACEGCDAFFIWNAV
jgi:hypothetical protein